MGIVVAIVLAVVLIVFCLVQKTNLDGKSSPYLTDEELKARNTAFCERRDHVTKILKSLVRDHSRALSTKRNQLMTKDAYGQYQSEKWVDETVYFCDNVLMPAIRKTAINEQPMSADRWDSVLSTEKCFDIINDELDQISLQQSDTIPVATLDTLDPREYEMYCSEILSSIGWSARTTKASGDQGIDIIAEKGTLKAVVQCKQYSTPVGNKAVQEVFAGKQHELADIAAVVTNSRFTKAAEELAQSCDVILLHHSQLQFFDEYVNTKV